GLSLFESPGLLFIPNQPGKSLRTRVCVVDGRTNIAGSRIIMGDSIVNELRLRTRSNDLFQQAAGSAFFIRIQHAQFSKFAMLFDDIFSEWKEKPAGYKDLILLKLSELCINAGRLWTPAPAAIDIAPNAKKIDEIIRYLENHFMENILLPQLAAELGYSPSYLSRFFKSKTGECLFEFVNRLRIQRACMLLKNTDKSVTETAFECGYNNISFFNRMFRRLMQCSPLEYRKRMG
ncbi:MAG: AraC family transcriptional regulator, partial [Spirochaetaceae bacterium]